MLVGVKANLGQAVWKIQFPYDKSNVKSDISDGKIKSDLSRLTERE